MQISNYLISVLTSSTTLCLSQIFLLKQISFTGLGAVYYFYPRKKEESSIKSYVIQPTIAAASGSSSGPRGFKDKMTKSSRRMVVFYGSQTGTAEEFAARLAKEGI